MTEIKAIFFDLGNVLVKFDPDILVNELKDKGTFLPNKLIDYFMDSKEMNRYMEGKLSSSQFFEKTKRYFKLKVKYKEFYHAWNEIFYDYPEMEKIVKTIKEKYPKIKLVLVSNTNEAHFEFIKKKYHVLKYLDDIVVSHEVGKLKPNAKIYRQALKLGGALPKETIYVDDRQDLIDSARVMGIRALFFTGHKQFLSDLAKFNIHM